MEGFFSLKTFLRLLAAAVVLAAVIILVDRKMGSTLLGKQAAAGEMVRVVEHTVEVTRLVERVITVTPGPAQTQPVSNAANLPPSTATPSPSPTPQGLYVPDDGVTVWCLPKTSYANTALFQIGEIPAEAVQSARENGRLTIITQTKSCTFMVSFSDDMPEGTLLKIQDLGPEPFINTPLVPLLNNPAAAAVTLKHYYVIDPPYWEVTYNISVVGQDGAILWLEPVVFKRSWISEPCPGGYLPDPQTALCP